MVESAHEDSVHVKTGALFRDGDQWFVYRVSDDGFAEKCEVELGLTNGLITELKSGLSAGDQVILHPTNQIAERVSVRLNE